MSSRLPARTALAGRRPTDRRSRTRTASSTTGIGRRAACADRSCRAARQRDSTHAAARPPARTAARTRAPDPDGDGPARRTTWRVRNTRHINRKRLRASGGRLETPSSRLQQHQSRRDAACGRPPNQSPRELLGLRDDRDGDDPGQVHDPADEQGSINPNSSRDSRDRAAPMRNAPLRRDDGAARESAGD